jgi:hypothetical protein
MSSKAARLVKKPGLEKKRRQREALSQQEPAQKLEFPQPEPPRLKPLG